MLNHTSKYCTSVWIIPPCSRRWRRENWCRAYWRIPVSSASEEVWVGNTTVSDTDCSENTFCTQRRYHPISPLLYTCKVLTYLLSSIKPRANKAHASKQRGNRPARIQTRNVSDHKWMIYSYVMPHDVYADSADTEYWIESDSTHAHRSLSESDGCGRCRYAASSIASRTRWSLVRGWGPSGAPPYRGLRRIVVVDDGCRGCVARESWVIVCCSLADNGRISDCSSRLLDMSTTYSTQQHV